MTFKNKKIILTGASSGIGLELLRYLIKNNADVFASSRRQKEILAEDEKKCQFKLIDLTNESEVKQYVDRIIDNTGKIDILINNAGVAQDLSLLEDLEYEEFQSVIKDNVMTTFNMIKYILPIMKKQNSGIIINVSSRS